MPKKIPKIVKEIRNNPPQEVNFAYQKAFQLITENKKSFVEIVEVLKSERTINGDVVNNILLKNKDYSVTKYDAQDDNGSET